MSMAGDGGGKEAKGERRGKWERGKARYGY